MVAKYRNVTGTGPGQPATWAQTAPAPAPQPAPLPTQPQVTAQGWAPPGFWDEWRRQLQQPAPTAGPRAVRPAQPAVPSREAPSYIPGLPPMPPGAPEYATEPEEYGRRGRELAGRLFPQMFGAPAENLPEWMRRPEEFLRQATAEGLGRAIRAFERPEERALLGGRPGEELYRVPGEAPSAVSPEEYKVLLDPIARLRAVEEKKEALPKWLQWDPLGIGTALAEVQVAAPAALKMWERFTERSPAARRAEQIGGVGLQLLQEPAIGLEQLTGAAAVMARPESKNLTVEQWYPLTTKTWSLAYDQARGRLGLGPRTDPRWGEDVLGTSLLDISSGRATADQIALSRESLGAELVGQIAADPLNVLDWVLAANRAARAKALSASQAKMLQAAGDSQQAQRALATLERGLAEAGLSDMAAFQKAADAAGISVTPGTWDKIQDAFTKPWQMTPEAKVVRDLEDMAVVLSSPIMLANSGDEALQILRAWADDPASLAPMFGRVPESVAGKKAGVVLRTLVDQLEDLPSFKGPDYSPVRAWIDIDELSHQVLRAAYGYEAPGNIQKFFLAYKRFMSEFYLNAAFSPGYVMRNTFGDGAAMATDGLMTFERAEDIERYMDQFGEITTRRLMTEGAASREALTGEGAIKSFMPGLPGRISEAGQRFTRFAEPLGRLPLGEESRYKRAIYMALKRFWNENAPGLLPDMPDLARARFGDQAEHLRLKIAHEADLGKRRQALTDFLEGTKGQQFEPTRYLDPEDLDAMSPVVLRNLRDELGKLTTENSADDLRDVIQRVRDDVDAAEAARLGEMEDLPPAIHVTTDVDEAEIADELIDSLEDIVARTGDEKLARQVEDAKKAIPKVEEALETARRQVIDDLMIEPAPEGMEILLRANAEVEDLRNAWRQTANKLRREAKAAYDANPMLADEIWTDYFRKMDEGWSDLARQRIGRFNEARDQLRRFREGEGLEDILGKGRQQLAEDRLLKASEVPERPRGFLPGRVLRSEEDAAFEQFLDWHRTSLDNTRTNAWRAVYGAEPEDYGKVVDLLDSADRDIEQFGKATAGKVAKLRDQAQEAAKKARKMHKSKRMADLAVDQVWEKYYILRNDAWGRFWDAAAQRWKIAERDVLWGNWSRGARMEPPAPVPTPRPPEAPPTPAPAQAALPAVQPGDEEIVRKAILKPDADWSDAEKKAIQRWTKSGQELPEIQPSIFPKAANIPPYTRQQFLDDLKGISGITDEQAEAMTALTDAAANVWARRTGRAPEEWYGQYLAGFRRGEPGPFELYQRAERLDTPQFEAWFGESKVVDEAGDPLVMYHGSAGAGFQAFDVAKADPYALYGPGFYFTDSADVASGYAGSEGIVKFAADDPTELLPRIQKAALEAEHPQVKAAREEMWMWADRWDEFVGGRGPSYTYTQADRDELRWIENEYERTKEHLATIERRYGETGANVDWEMQLRNYPAEAVDRALRRYGIDTAGIIDQLGAPGIYPVHLSIRNPFDLDAIYTAEDYQRIVGRTPPSMTMTYTGEQLYETMQAGAYVQSQGMPPKQWINRKLQLAGYDGIAHTGGKIMGGKPHQVFIAFEPHQVKSIFNKGDWSTRPHILYQGGSLGAKGAVDFLDDGRAMFRFFESADISTGLHEIGHVFRRTLPDADLATVEKWAGLGMGEFDNLYPVAVEHQWLSNLPRRSAQQEERMGKLAGAAKRYEDAEEKFARAFERYLIEGEAPAPELARTFERFKEWLIEIYRKIVGTSLDVQMDDKIRGVMDRLLAESPTPRPGDPFGREVYDLRQTARREEVAQAISGYRRRPPLDIQDAQRMYQIEDPQQLVQRLEDMAREHEALSTRESLRQTAYKRTHAGMPAGYEGMKHRWDFGEAVDIQAWRTGSKKSEADLYWELQGIDPKLSTGEKVRQANQFLQEQKELADWYYSLAMQAQDLAAGRPIGELATAIPEAVARESLERMENFERLREVDDLDEILQELGYSRRDLFPGEVPERPMPAWAEEFEEGVGARLYQRGKERPERIDPALARQAMAKAKQRTHVWTEYIQAHYRATGDLAPGADARDLYAWLETNMPEELGAITAKVPEPKAGPFRAHVGVRYQTPDGVGTAFSVETGRGAKRAFIEFPDGTRKEYTFDQLQAIDVGVPYAREAPKAAPPAEYTPPAYIQEAIQRREAQQAGEELPLFARPKEGYRHVERAMERALAGEPRPIRQTAAMRVRTDLTESLMDIDADIGVAFHQQNDPAINATLQELVNQAENQRRWGVPDPELDAKLQQLSEYFDLPEPRLGETMPQFRPELAPEPPAPRAAPPVFGEVPRARPAQMGMFEAGEELPLFTGTAPRAEGARFAPPEAAGAPMLPGMEPAMGDIERYAARPVEAAAPAAAEGWEPARVLMTPDGVRVAQTNLKQGMAVLTPDGEGLLNSYGPEFINVKHPRWGWVKEYPIEQVQVKAKAAELELLRPKRAPKGQMTLWQEPEQLGFWRMDPDQWRQYIEAINQPGATAGPLPHEILQRSTDATRRSLDKIEQGMTRDWDQWEQVFTDRQAQQQLTDWFDNEVTPSWYENRAVAYDYARSQADFSILDYSKRRNFDVWMAYVFPYHYWFTRAGKNWAQRLAKRPGMLANYVRSRDAMKLANQQAGRRQRFEGMVGVPFPWLPDWMGDKVYVDPLAMIAPFSQIFGTDWDDSEDSKRGLRGIYATAQRFGLRPYHIWDYLYQQGAFAKAGEMAGMAPEAAQQMLGPEYTGNFPNILPQTGVVRGITSLARELGAEAMPPGGVNIEAPLRRAIGLPAGEVWDPYRINRMLANLSAEKPQDMGLAQAALRAQELVSRDETQTGKMWDPSSQLAQETAAEMGWTEEQLAEAQRLLADAMQKATLERGIGTLGWAMGPRMAIEPRGERGQLEMAEQARATTWSPTQPGGSREAYEQFKREHPAMYPRSTQYNILPGEKEYEAMAPGARANWLILRNQREMLHADYDRAVDDLLRAEPWNWSGRNEIENQRRAALAGLEAKYPMPEMEGEIPAILYGMNPGEMWNSTVEKELYRLQATKPDPSAFETEEGVDWDAYYKAETKWRASLPRTFGFGFAQGGMYSRMDPKQAMQQFEQRYDSPLEAAYKVYQKEVAAPAWNAYNKAKADEERLWPGMRNLQDQYWDLPKEQRGAFVRQHPDLPNYWDWKDQQGSAYDRTVGRVEATPAAALIDLILEQYQIRGWTKEQLKEELAGVVFPSLRQQQELKKGRQAGTSATQGATGAAGRTQAAGPTAWTPQYSARELNYLKNKILRQWNARQGRYRGYGGGGYGGGGYTSRRYQEAQYPRWRPPGFERGGPFTGTAGMIWGGPFRG